MKRYLIFFVLFFLTSPFVSSAADSDPSGIVFPVTRVIYPENKEGGISFSLTNNTDNVYLLQSRVISAGTDNADDKKPPFIVIPPLTRFEPGKTVTLLIRKTEKLPDNDKESLWLLALKTIPSQPDNRSRQDGGASLIIALQNNFKLFYRPAELPSMTENMRAEALTFAVDGEMLVVTNPTPYYITLHKLLTDGKSVDMSNNKMIAPYSTLRYPSASRLPSEISWSVIDDNGAAEQAHKRTIN